MVKRVILFIMDSVGIGALPDAEAFGDLGANTLGHIAQSSENFRIPNLRAMGLGNIDGTEFVEAVENPSAAFGRCAEVSNGKDTTTGHWEISGLFLEEPFQTYPDGFPNEVISEFEKRTGKKVLCNRPYSGTEVIKDYGKEHMETGNLIVYTSADSVFQIAAHEDVVPIESLYEFCKIAREILRGSHQVARVIARPFIGKLGAFERTANRRDYSLNPFGKTVLDFTKEAGLSVQAVGKIVDIFNGQGITEAVHTKSNMDGVDKTIDYLKTNSQGIIFTNLVDFDAKYGHRRDVDGYRKAIEDLDARIPEILSAMREDDVIIFTADHGNDPTFKGTDHTREYVPMLIFGKSIIAGTNLGTRKTFSDMAATISDFLGVQPPAFGTSFRKLIERK